MANDSYQYCTCNKYTAGSCPCNSTRSHSNSCTGYSYTITQGTKISSDPSYEGDVQCYSYASDPTDDCVVHGERIDPWYAYACPGHRNYNHNGLISFQSYNVGDIICNSQISSIQSYLCAEIAQRKCHSMYSSESDYTDTSVQVSTLIAANKPNTIEHVLTQLRDRINELDDNNNDHELKYNTINIHDILSNNNITPLQEELNAMYTDCVCFSDCIAYGKWIKHTCQCNYNCNCNY